MSKIFSHKFSFNTQLKCAQVPLSVIKEETLKRSHEKEARERFHRETFTPLRKIRWKKYQNRHNEIKKTKNTMSEKGEKDGEKKKEREICEIGRWCKDFEKLPFKRRINVLLNFFHFNSILIFISFLRNRRN